MSSSKAIIPDDYQDYVYRFTYWVLGKIAHLVPSKISPNQITIAAFSFAMMGTYLLYAIKTPSAYLYWVLFNFLWYIFDALDGIHARLTNQSSEYGAFLDHALDNIYFLAMFTVFVIKFDLMHMLYIYIIFLRITTSVMVFTVQCHTNRLYLDKFSGGTELILFSAAMILTYFFPNYNPLFHTISTTTASWIEYLNLDSGLFMKLALLVYFVGSPIYIVKQFIFVKRQLS